MNARTASLREKVLAARQLAAGLKNPDERERLTRCIDGLLPDVEIVDIHIADQDRHIRSLEGDKIEHVNWERRLARIAQLLRDVFDLIMRLNSE